MLLKDFVAKYAGSNWFCSKQEVTEPELRSECELARKYYAELVQNYRCMIDDQDCVGYWHFDENERRFKGLMPCCKKEVALFTLFVVRYVCTEKATVELYLTLLEKFKEEFVDLAEELQKFGDEIRERV